MILMFDITKSGEGFQIKGEGPLVHRYLRDNKNYIFDVEKPIHLGGGVFVGFFKVKSEYRKET